MNAYILGVCGAVIISALAAILLPEGKTGKFINGILKLFCLLVMLIPLFAFLRDYRVPDSGDTASDIVLDEGFIDYFYGQMAEEEAAALDEKLEEESEAAPDVRTEWNIVEYAYEVSKVTIEIENFGMYGDDEHILVISEIEARAAEWMNVSSEAVEVYERQ